MPCLLRRVGYVPFAGNQNHLIGDWPLIMLMMRQNEFEDCYVVDATLRWVISTPCQDW